MILFDPILELAKRLEAYTRTDGAFARENRMNAGYVRWLRKCQRDGTLRWSAVLAGDDWQDITVAFPATGEDLPGYVLVPYPPRQCPVTDLWFLPVTTSQRFVPGLSAAAKREARRDVEKARRKYQLHGDWGRADG